MILPREISASPGPYKLDRGFSYWRDILQTVQSPHTEEVILNLPTQLGKTTLLQCLLIALSINDPGPGMIAGPDRDEMRRVRDEIFMIIEESKLARYIPPERERNMVALRVQGVPWHLGWPGTSGQRLSGKSCRYVLATECSKWRQLLSHGKSQDLARERTKAWTFFKRVMESTPTDKDCFITKEYLDKSDQRKFHFECPTCGHWQELRWKVHHAGEFKGCGGVTGYRTEQGELLDPDEAQREAYYLCEQGCRIEERSRKGMVAGGKWVPKGQHVDPETRELAGTPERSPRIAGYNCCSLIGRTITFGRMAAAWCRSEGNPKEEQNFVNHWWGRRYVPRKREAKPQVLAARLRLEVEQAVAPRFVRFLTTQVDVQPKAQGTEYPWMVMGWGQFGRGHLIDYGICFSEDDVREVLEPLRVYEHEDGGVIRTKWSCIDSSDGATQEDVYRISRSIRFCVPVKGMSLNNPEAFKLSAIDEAGRRADGGRSMWERLMTGGETLLVGVNTDFTQSWLEQQFHGKDVAPESRFTICVDASMNSDLLDEFLNETPIFGVNKSGLKTTGWERRDSHRPNDMRDLVRYGKTMAQLLTDNGRHWESLPNRPTPEQIKVEKEKARRTRKRPAEKTASSITSGGGRQWE